MTRPNPPKARQGQEQQVAAQGEGWRLLLPSLADQRR
jgi:hypothetical protein